jgi:hypothetical protein
MLLAASLFFYAKMSPGERLILFGKLACMEYASRGKIIRFI